MQELTLGELWQRAPLTFIMLHVGVFALGYLLMDIRRCICKRNKT